MHWMSRVQGDPISWLLELDESSPSVRYLTLKNILRKPQEDPEVVQARADAMKSGPIPTILDAMDPGGYWVQPGPGYYPKYQGTVWQIMFLAQMGADGSHDKIKAACSYILENCPSQVGGFSMNGNNSGMIHCLEGNLVAALIALGMFGDGRLDRAVDWLARSVTGRGIADSREKGAIIRYLRSGNSGPGFLCSANDQLPCAWGAVKAMLGLLAVPTSVRSSAVQEAIEIGADFLLSVDPAGAEYPMGYSAKPNRSWFKFGFPVAYVTDVLQNLDVLTQLDLGPDPRLANALELLLSKQNDEGRWLMEYTYNGKTWVDIEKKNQPSKWVTYRALKVLKQASA